MQDICKGARLLYPEPPKRERVSKSAYFVYCVLCLIGFAQEEEGKTKKKIKRMKISGKDP